MKDGAESLQREAPQQKPAHIRDEIRLLKGCSLLPTRTGTNGRNHAQS